MLFSTGSFRASDAVIEAFEAWHQLPVSKEVIERPVPELMTLYPGMSSVTQVLPDRVRDYLLKRFKKSHLNADDWAHRWRLAEDRLLEGGQDAFDVITALEALGREAIERRLTEEGLNTGRGPMKILGARASRYFLQTDQEQTAEYLKILSELATASEPLLKQALILLPRFDLDKGLTKPQQVDVAQFLLELHQAFTEYEDLGHVAAALNKVIAEEMSDFEKELGFRIPNPEGVYPFLSKFRQVAGKR